MILKNLIAAVGVAGTLGAAAPAFADWYQPAPVVVPPAPVVVTPPAYSYGYGYRYEGRPDWRWRPEREWRHWRGEHERREHGGWWHHDRDRDRW